MRFLCLSCKPRIVSSCLGVQVRQITWNPGFPDIIAVLLTDGQLMIVKLTGTVATVIAKLQGIVTAGEV